MIDRARVAIARRAERFERVETGRRARPRSSRRSRRLPRRRAPPRRPAGLLPSARTELLAERQRGDDRHVRGAASLIEGDAAAARGPRTSRGRSGPPRLRADPRSAPGTRPGPRPRVTGAPRPGGPSGPTEPPTSASRPVTSRASRASCAARRLMAPTCPSRPQAARRCRFAPNDRVSISSAPASRYSRCAAPTSSGCVMTSSSRQARCGTPRLNSSVPRPPSTSSGRSASRLRKRSRGRPAGMASVIGPLWNGSAATGPEWERPFLLGRVSGSPLSCRRTCPDLAPCRLDAGRLSWLQRAGPSATLDKTLFGCGAMVPHRGRDEQGGRTWGQAAVVTRRRSRYAIRQRSVTSTALNV